MTAVAPKSQGGQCHKSQADNRFGWVQYVPKKDVDVPIDNHVPQSLPESLDDRYIYADIYLCRFVSIHIIAAFEADVVRSDHRLKHV